MRRREGGQEPAFSFLKLVPPQRLVGRLPQRRRMKRPGPQRQRTVKEQQPWKYPAHLPHVET